MVFVTTCLAVFVLAFLTMICIQVIRLEKRVDEMSELVEEKVTKLYTQET